MKYVINIQYLDKTFMKRNSDYRVPICLMIVKEPLKIIRLLADSLKKVV